MVAYGHAGYPLLMFPTAAADYLEYERFHLIEAISPFIDSGKIRAYAINSVTVAMPQTIPSMVSKLRVTLRFSAIPASTIISISIDLDCNEC